MSDPLAYAKDCLELTEALLNARGAALEEFSINMVARSFTVAFTEPGRGRRRFELEESVVRELGFEKALRRALWREPRDPHYVAWERWRLLQPPA